MHYARKSPVHGKHRDKTGVQAWKNPNCLWLLSYNVYLLHSVIPYLVTWNRMQLCYSSLWYLLVREIKVDLGGFGWNSEVAWSITAWPEVPDQIGATRARLPYKHAHPRVDIVGLTSCENAVWSGFFNNSSESSNNAFIQCLWTNFYFISPFLEKGASLRAGYKPLRYTMSSR